ncbi:MAG: leucine-rich repeat protein, partial [Butyrivibrio sp.]|nr:leucine-rich repeat protein [Butyrivibrio sp.]
YAHWEDADGTVVYADSTASVIFAEQGENWPKYGGLDIRYGETVPRPADPVPSPGYRFVNWYADEQCTQLYDFSQPVLHKFISIYAKFELDQTKADDQTTGDDSQKAGDDGQKPADSGDYRGSDAGQGAKPVITDDNSSTSMNDNSASHEIHPGMNFNDTSSGSQYTFTNDDSVEYVLPGNNKSRVVIPESMTVDGKSYPVTAVSDNAFKNNKTVTSVTIGKNITQIGSGAFQGASKLKSVNMKDCNVTSIGKNAFSKCKNLKSLTINANSLSSVSKNAFKGVKKKVKVKVYAKDKKAYNKAVKKLKKAGLKNADFKFKKSK